VIEILVNYHKGKPKTSWEYPVGRCYQTECPIKDTQELKEFYLPLDNYAPAREVDNMHNQINLWAYLPKEIQKELIKHADSIGTETIYIWRRPYYARRNALILKRYHQLKTNTNKPDKEIYDQIAKDVSELLGKISAKAVKHVITRNVPNT